MVDNAAVARPLPGEVAASEEGEVARSVVEGTGKLGARVALVESDASYLFDGPCEA